MRETTRTTTLAPEAEPVDMSAKLLLWLASGLALVCYALVLLGLFAPIKAGNMQAGLEAALLVGATLATLVALLRELPLQNILLATVAITIIGGGVHTLGAATGLPFGPFTYLDEVGPCFHRILAWPMPLIWTVVILNSRGVARLVLRPWRKLKNYGLWLITMTVVLSVIMDLLLDPFASSVRHYWVWDLTKIPFTWQGAPVTNFFGWAVASLLILGFITPPLIKKRGSSKTPPQYQPLVVWGLAALLFTATGFVHKMWAVGGLGAGALLLVCVFSVRGARW